MFKISSQEFVHVVVCLNYSVHICWQHFGSEGCRTSHWHPFCRQRYLQRGTSGIWILHYFHKIHFNIISSSMFWSWKFTFMNEFPQQKSVLLCLHHVSHLQNWLEPWLSDNRTAVGEELPSGRSADQCQATVPGVHTDPLPLSVVAPLLSACLCLQTHGLICKKRMCPGFHCKLLCLTLR